MTAIPSKSILLFGLLLLAGQRSSFSAPLFGRTALGVCDLLGQPNKYRDKVVTVKARAYLGMESFSIDDHSCDGDIEINISKTPRGAGKYGFLTKQDKNYQEFMQRVKENWQVKTPIGWHCVAGGNDCGPSKFLVTVTFRALFRCNIHPEDSKPCGMVSHGNSEIVIKSVTKVKAEPLPFPKGFPFPPADEPPKK